MRWTEEQKSAINAVAKQCAKELNDTFKRKGDEVDKVTAKIVDKHHKKVASIITVQRFSYHIGYINGKLSRGL